MLITSNTNKVFYEVTKLKSKPKNTNLRNYLNSNFKLFAGIHCLYIGELKGGTLDVCAVMNDGSVYSVNAQANNHIGEDIHDSIMSALKFKYETSSYYRPDGETFKDFIEQYNHTYLSPTTPNMVKTVETTMPSRRVYLSLTKIKAMNVIYS